MAPEVGLELISVRGELLIVEVYRRMTVVRSLSKVGHALF